MLQGVDIEADTATFHHALSATLQLARRYKLSAYDASYLELALRQGIPIATLDVDLQKAARKAGVKRFDGNAKPKTAGPGALGRGLFA